MPTMWYKITLFNAHFCLKNARFDAKKAGFEWLSASKT
jgi:hypothetical protein